MLKLMRASAGSGKTYSLARQYITLLLKSTDRYAYRHILAVTFTNKATDEMKRRILKELHVMAVNPSASGYLDSFVPSVFPDMDKMSRKAGSVLQDILHDYGAFAVSTIDRFFQQALKAFSREIGHFASYQVELDRDSLVAESVDRILDSLTEDDRGLLSWLTSNVLEQIERGGKYRTDANLMDMAGRMRSQQRRDVMELHGIDPDEICSKERLLEIRKRCRDVTSAFRKEVSDRAQAALAVLSASGVAATDSRYKFMNQMNRYVGLKSSYEIEPPTPTFFKYAPDSESWFTKTNAKRLLPLVYPALSGPLDAFTALWGKEYAVYKTARLLDDQLYGLGVASELSRTFSELMKEKNVICLDDSNMLLRDIIDGSDAPFVYEKLGVRYEHFLLDEFQDTSLVQWLNFSPLLHNSDAQGSENLIVGDIKQSIYRWRGSDWNLLDEKVPSEFAQVEETVLDTNYRSRSGIIEFNNGFFVYAAKYLDALNGNGDMSRIYADVVQKVAKRDKAPGSVDFTFCPKEKQLDALLEGIRKVCDAGARLSEITVLVRNNRTGEKIAGFLIDNGIDVLTDDSLYVKTSLTVRRIISLMSYMDNPGDSVGGYLAGAMNVEPAYEGGSLMDVAEDLYRKVKCSDTDQQWKGELLHIQSFMDYLQDYVSSCGNDLRGFLKQWDEADPKISSPSSGESVRIMTVHKSKGLDFPYVMIPFAEEIVLYKHDRKWCRPAVEGTALEDVADGVYDVDLTEGSASTLFAEDYHRERFLQQIDNMNILYVAMTRASLGMHIISETPSDKLKNFSKILHDYLEISDARREETGDTETFGFGEFPDFCSEREEDREPVRVFPIGEAGEFPSIPLNGGEESLHEDVRVRGRLKYSADSLDFFLGERTGIAASNRLRGIVLHDILSQVRFPGDLKAAVDAAVGRGDLSSEEGETAYGLLSDALASVEGRGWFSVDVRKIHNEVSIIDTDGSVYRPDRVIETEDKVVVIDYKFGEHQKKYERQMRRYSDLWRRMGHETVESCLWYVDTGEVRFV